MRLLLGVLALILLVGFLGFLATNPTTTVPVTIVQTQYQDVPLWLVVLAALTVMCVLMGIYTVAEGAATRLENRRLKRELHKLETEINYLRTQPRVTLSPDLDDVAPPEGAAATEPPAGSEQQPPSAPVYGDHGDDWNPESDDDDVYSGGRAV